MAYSGIVGYIVLYHYNTVLRNVLYSLYYTVYRNCTNIKFSLDMKFQN